MLKAHKIALDPTNVQVTMLVKSAGTARFAYNWALSEWRHMYEANQADPAQPKPTQLLLRRRLNAIKRTEFPWMLEVTKCAAQEAIINLGRAFANFFAHRAAYPAFKKKGVHDSFKVSSGFFKVDGPRIRIPNIGWIRMCEPVRFDGKLKSLTVSRQAGRWFASVVVEAIDVVAAPKDGDMAIGVDVGVGEFVTDNGVKTPLPRAYRTAQSRLRRVQKSLSRKQKGSTNRKKAADKVARLHARTANVRSDFLHKYTSALVARPDTATIVIEDLNVCGMVKNHHLAKSIADASFGEFRRQLEYKCKEGGIALVIADRFYPSSKTCSVCGHKLGSLPLSIRSWSCPDCGAKHDRDINAAINLRRYAESSPVSACGEFFASGANSLPVRRQATSAKQELSIKSA